MILPQTIEEIFNTARVEEVIADFVNLKRSGTNLKGLSPFSNERTPSFVVSPTKQIWKDFSSGKGGNVVSFLMEHENFSYPEALKWLAKKYNIEVKEEDTKDTKTENTKSQREALYQISSLALSFFINQLNDTEEGIAIGKAYFQERGFTNHTLEIFQLGYSPKKIDAFSTHALKNGFKENELILSGLGIKREGSSTFVDRFRERVIFPVFSFSGRVVGFGARILKNETNTAKYLNSPESEIYHKSQLLYGFFQAKNEIRKKNQCILLEGYTDVLSFYQSGIKNVVASSGTALTFEQIRLIKRLTDNILLIYDGDSAGIKASFRGIDLLLEQGMNIEVLALPIGDDPDSFAKKLRAEELEEYLQANATDFIRFKAKILLDEAGDSPSKKAEIINDIVDSISIIESPVKRDLYIQEAAKILNIQEKVLFGALAQKTAKDNLEANNRNKNPTNNPLKVVRKETKDFLQDSWLRLEHEIIQLLLDYGDQKIELNPTDGRESIIISIGEFVIEQFELDEIAFRSSFYQKLYNQFKQNLESEEYKKVGSFGQLMDEETANVVAEMVLDKHNLSNWESKGISITPKEKKSPQLAMDLVYSYKLLTIEEMIEESSKNVREENRTEIIEKIMQLIELRKKIKSMLNRIV